MPRTLTIVLLVIIPLSTLAQSCCVAGVPTNMTTVNERQQQGSLGIGLGYNLNHVSRVVDGSNRLDSDGRKNYISSYAIAFNYGLNSWLGGSVFIPYLSKVRTTSQNQRDIASGIGDIMIGTSIKVFEAASTKGDFAAVLKLPTGSVSQRDQNQVPFSIDMQPGTGSYDVLTSFNFIHQLKAFPGSFTANALMRINNPNTFKNRGLVYQAGHLFEIRQWLSHDLPFQRMLASFFIGIHYRYARQDTLNDENLGNTGGQWAFLEFGNRVLFANKSWIRISVEFPFAEKVNSEQLTSLLLLNFNYSIQYEKTSPTSVDLFD